MRNYNCDDQRANYTSEPIFLRYVTMFVWWLLDAPYRPKHVHRPSAPHHRPPGERYRPH